MGSRGTAVVSPGSLGSGDTAAASVGEDAGSTAEASAQGFRVTGFSEAEAMGTASFFRLFFVQLGMADWTVLGYGEPASGCVVNSVKPAGRSATSRGKPVGGSVKS